MLFSTREADFNLLSHEIRFIMHETLFLDEIVTFSNESIRFIKVWYFGQVFGP